MAAFRNGIGGAVVVLCVLFACGQARAADDVEGLIARGIELREQGKDDQALELFRKADATASSPRTKAQVGLAEQALGIWVAAEAHVQAALAANGDPWIERYRTEIASALATIQKHLGSLDVRAAVPGAEVFVDGQKIGTLPMAAPLRVEVGRRAIEVRAPGYHRASRATDVAAGAITRETFELVRADPEAPHVASAPLAVIQAPRAGSVQRTMGWLFVGTGAAASIIGVVGLVARQSAVSAYNDDATCPGLGNATQPPQCQDRISSANTWHTLSIASFIAGGALGLGGVVLVLTAPPSSSAPAAAHVGCGPIGAGLACSGAF